MATSMDFRAERQTTSIPAGRKAIENAYCSYQPCEELKLLLCIFQPFGMFQSLMARVTSMVPNIYPDSQELVRPDLLHFA